MTRSGCGRDTNLSEIRVSTANAAARRTMASTFARVRELTARTLGGTSSSTRPVDVVSRVFSGSSKLKSKGPRGQGPYKRESEKREKRRSALVVSRRAERRVPLWVDPTRPAGRAGVLVRRQLLQPR